MANQAMLKSKEQQIRQTALSALVNGRELLNKSYLSELGQFDLQTLEKFPSEKINFATDVRIFKVERVVLENKQSMLESMTAAYTALGTAGYSVFLLLQSNGSETILYLGTRGTPNKMQGGTAGQLLDETFKGHFSGSQLERLKGKEGEMLMKDFAAERSLSITAVTGVPSLSVEEREHFMQGLEHFIDAAEGREYQALILAEPVSAHQLDMIQAGYEGIATQLSPLLKQTLSFGENESDSVGLSISEGISHSFGTSIGLTETKGTSYSISRGKNFSQTNGTSSSTSTAGAAQKAVAVGSTVANSAIQIAALAGTAVNPLIGIGISVGGAVLSTVLGSSTTEGISSSTTTGTSENETEGSSESTAKSKTENENTAINKNKAHSTNQTIGSSRQITLEMTDKNIEQMLKKVDQQLERVNEARRYGGWNSAAYFISDNTAASQSLASMFLGLMRGANSNSEDFSLTTWDNTEVKGRQNKALAKDVLTWLANLSHPRLTAEFSQGLGVGYLTPSTLVSGKEMAIQLSLPRRSTSTVTVVEAIPFGRRIQNVNGQNEKAERVVNLGQVRHLWQDLPQKVELDVEKLSSHIFITGSTGSGKSNTVYQLLDQLNQNDVKFMVIEPAKGEYKNVFGFRSDVKVFGTNPQKTSLLRINPFKFPEDIHVLEHIDRLVEIFNVCWPMYAAMPAVLKDAMLEAYKASGWNLETSENRHKNLFPSFKDLLQQLEKVINESKFSQEVKSNYEGSLVTRVKSLTNGLNGQIFSADEVDNHILFDENVIVDLSRIGSQETKSLIMGILVMRLSEHRTSESNGMNVKLKHVTVLEEAHNILKRTSTEQSSEGSNVAGKAVEMLSNAIAEMRTYGEGFIIADQSPGAVDISAIRNTNTKIIMRLPEETDRRLAAKASGVTDEQLEEIAKLPKGVAVVYQNDWLEPILCKIHRFETQETLFIESDSHLALKVDSQKQFQADLADLLFSRKVESDKKLDLDQIRKSIEKSALPVEFKTYFNDVISEAQRGIISLLLQKDTEYLIDLYQRLTQQYLKDAMPDLHIRLQQNLCTEKMM
ncbi:ATP-binding protein [Ursidibacter arcticus]|uniref:ATP-binding protein n=1 Tax=Ursidibacter arcticus TaxID=1524965 RepID=UPI0019671B52|nr:ATPase, T2SS/T4P/T4SS family [Ursidibacter arcticus]KAE9534123.1 ATP-binding protein [Ursidibacter arcticus]